MGRILALLHKELSEHGWVLFGVLAFVGFVEAVLLLGAAVGPRTITMLEAHETFTRWIFPLLAVALGHRLVVREYYGRTQRFLEALPIHRWEVLLTKYVTGLVALIVALAASLLAATAAAAFKEPLSGVWLSNVWIRSEVFAFALWSVLFAMGLLGRWRIPIYVGAALVALFLEQSTDVELARFGPFAVIGDTFVLERRELPWAELGVTLAIGLGALLVGALLGLMNEGSVAESLARAMTRREKATVGILFALSLIVFDVADPKRAAEPFAFESEAVVARPGLEVLYLEPRHRAAAEGLADALADDLESLRDALGFARMPRVHVALRETLDARTFEEVPLEGDDDGVLVHAAFTAPRFDSEGLRTFVLDHALIEATDGRAAFEPHAWVRQATARRWARRDGADDPAPILAALWLARHRVPRASLLERSRRTEERFGRAAQSAWAWSAAESVARSTSERRWLDFARSVLVEEPPWALAAVIEARTSSVWDRLADHTSLDAAGLAEEQGRTLAAWRAGPEGRALARMPRARASLEVEAVEGQLRAVRWTVRFSSPPAPGALCTLLHAPLGPFDAVLEPSDLSREERACAELAADGERLVGRYGPGERAFFAIELLAEPLGAPVRLISERRTLR